MNILENIKFKEELTIVLSHLEGKNIEFKSSKEELVDKIIRKVYQVVDSFIDISSGIEEEVLFQEVYQALLEASFKNNLKLMGGFESSAMMEIQARIEILFLKNKFDLPMSNSEKRRLMIYFMNVVNNLTIALGRTPTTNEIATKLGIEEKDILNLSFIYNGFRNSTNISGIELAMDETYSKEDEHKFCTKDVITKLLINSDLNGQELCVILLHFGIILPNMPSIRYNRKDIILDGIPKSRAEICSLLSLTRERVRQILSSAYYKLEISKEVQRLDVIEYVENPNLVLKLQSIYSWIAVIPYTSKYPNFKSYFEHYTEEEINTALNMLEKKDLLFIAEIDKFNENVTDFYYGTKEIRKLYTIIKNTYKNLINLYGKRSMTIEFCLDNNVQYKSELNNIRDFFKNVSDGNETIGLYGVTKLKDYQRGVLFQIYGNDLRNIPTPSEMLKHNKKTIAACENVIGPLRQMSASFDISKCIQDIEKTYIFDRIKQNTNEQGIYRFLGFVSPNMIEDSLNTLFIQELNILKEVFGDDLKDNNYLENINKLSIIKLNIFVNIIINQVNYLKEQLKEEKTNIRKQRRVEAFYNIFFYVGYSLEEIDDVFKNVIGLDIIYEYLKRGTPQERRTQIINIILNSLNLKYGENIIYRSNKESKKNLKLLRTYNSIISNTK